MQIDTLDYYEDLAEAFDAGVRAPVECMVTTVLQPTGINSGKLRQRKIANAKN